MKYEECRSLCHASVTRGMPSVCGAFNPVVDGDGGGLLKEAQVCVVSVVTDSCVAGERQALECVGCLRPLDSNVCVQLPLQTLGELCASVCHVLFRGLSLRRFTVGRWP